METSDILRQLRPLMPRRVRLWEQALAFGTPQTKKRLEQHIRGEATKILGRSGRLLLSLPPRQVIQGSLELGTVLYEKEKWPFGFEPAELLQNLSIFGRSGSGKTNTLFLLLLRLEKKRIPFLFLDWKRTARHLLPLLAKKTKVFTAGRSVAPLSFNPLLAPPGIERSVYVGQVVDVLASAFTLGEGAKSVVQKAILASYAKTDTPTFSDVHQEITALSTKDRETGWKLSALRAIESVRLGTSEVDPKKQQAFAKELLRYSTIIELDGLPQNVKKFLIPLLCSWVFSSQLSGSVREKLKLVVVFEEAHHVLYRQEHRHTESLMNQLLRQGRELGIGSVVVDQHPHLISSAALGNCFTTICLNQKNPSDINKAASLSLLRDFEKEHLSLLPIGRGIAKMQDRWRKPFLVDFPLVPLKKGAVTDSMIAEFSRGTLTLSGLRERCGFQGKSAGNTRECLGGNSGVIRRSRLFVTVEDDASDLLSDIVRFPDDGVDIRYKRLRFSAGKGNKLKGQLVDAGLVQERRKKTGRTYRVILEPTNHAREVLSAKHGNDPQGSFAHEYWKQEIAGQLQEQGYEVSLEAPRQKSSGCMDILAVKKSKRIAVEIETGKSDVVSNVKRDLLEGAREVVVVATSDEALKKIEKQLAKAGLIIPERVKVVFGW